jgi:hypothetical protein
MAEGDIVLYNSFKKKLLEGVFNLASGGHTLKVTLHSGYTPDLDAHDEWADVASTEYGSGAGYTAGGLALTGQSVALDALNDRAVFDADDAGWSSLGPLSPATPSHAILWDDTVSGDPLIGYIELGVTATNGGNYTLQFNSAGVFVLA